MTVVLAFIAKAFVALKTFLFNQGLTASIIFSVVTQQKFRNARQALMLPILILFYTTLIVFVTSLMSTLVTGIDGFFAQFAGTLTLWHWINGNINYFFPMDTLISCILILLTFHYTDFSLRAFRWGWSVMNSLFQKIFKQ
ncbi:MAG: hypothetical protein FWF59_12780 [Turicibacter sp.]|nr:hypothetical protein [Turicibacter sp.]